MKKAGFIFSIILVTVFYSGRVQSQSMFQKIIGGTAGDEISYNAQMTADSGLIIVGSTDGFGAGLSDVYLTKTDVNGALEWNKTYGGAGTDIGYDVSVTADGGYIIVGSTNSSGAGGNDVFLIKTTSVGDTMWTRTYGGTGVDIGYSVKQTFDGGYVLIGYTGSFGTAVEDIYVIKTDANGDTTWTRTYGNASYNYGYSIIQTADSGYIFTGEEDYLGVDDAFLIRTDSMGDTLWTKTYGGAGAEGGWDVIQTIDGGFALAGWSSTFGAGALDFLLIKTDAMGDTSWTRTYGGSLVDVGLSLVETSDKSYLVSGYTFSFGTVGGDAYAIAVDSTGTELWSMTYGGTSGESCLSLDRKADGGYVLGAYSYSLGGGDANFYLLHTDSIGSTGSCYESTITATTTSSAMTLGTLNVSTTMNATIGINGTTVTTPSGISRPEFSVAISSSANLGCNGDSSGTATVATTGGSASFTYVWDDLMAQSNVTADTLSIGTYKVIVTDGFGCVDSASVTITEPIVLTASITDSLDVACNGDSTGSATVTPAGGTSPYFYLWDDVNTQTDSIGNGLPAGNFSVVVSDTNSCQVTVNTTIAESTVLALSTSTTQAGCGLSNGTANVTASGATSPFTYSWNTSPVQTDSVATGLAFGLYTVTVNDSLGCTDSASVSITNTGGPSVSITDSVNVLCNGDSTGSATVTPVGGTLPYVYLWNDSNAQTDSMAIGLPIGVYTVNVTDSGGCGATAVITITEPAAALSLSITNDTLGCFADSSGTATVVATGGTTGYVYAWDDPLTQSTAGATGLSAGAVQVIVTDSNGCTDSASATLTEPAGFVMMISDSNHIACSGDGDGSATVSASGGLGPLSYLWDDPSTQTDSAMAGVAGGTYTCTVTDSVGCSQTISFTVNEPPAITLSVSSSVTVTCNTDSSATMSAVASGGLGILSYLWDDPSAQTTDTATAVPNGNYTVVITDSVGCSVTNSLTVGLLATSMSTSPICGGICTGTAIVTVTGNAGTITYLWDDPAGTTTVSASNLCDGTSYVATVSDTSGCTTSSSVTFAPLASLTIVFTITDVNCFGDSNGAVTAFVSGGATIYTYSWPSLGLTNAFINTLTAGNYDLVLTDGNGCTITETASVTQPAALFGSIVPTPVSCFGGSDGAANLTVTGGTSPYAYTWGPGNGTGQDTSGLASTGYACSITDDNGCTYIAGTFIWQASILSLSGSSSPNTGGNSGKVWVNVSGGTPSYTYLWNDPDAQVGDSATGLAHGEYTVIVTDGNGCTSELDLAVGDQAVSLFETSYEGSQDDLARDMDILTGGGHIIVGVTESFGGDSASNMFLISTDVNGNISWAKTYGGSGDDGANAGMQTSDGGYILAGYTSSFGSGNTDMYVVKTDVNGVVEWSQTYGGPMDEKAYSIVERTGGYVIAGGTNSFGAGQTDVYVIDIDDNGVIQWTKTYGGSDYDYGYDIKATTDGGYIIAGYTNSFGAGAADAYLIKIDASGGSTWTKVMGGDKDDAAWSVIQTPTGYAFTGNTESFGSGQQDVFFVITDLTGTPTLTTAFGGAELDYGNDLISTNDGGFAITGYSRSFSNFGDDVYLIKTNASGVVTWSRSFGGSFSDRGWALQETSSGELVIAGNSQSTAISLGAGKWAYYLIKTDSSGNSECNLGSPITVEKDTVGAPITIGGLEGAGGSASTSSTTESVASILSEIICYTSTGIRHITTETFQLGLYPNPNNGQFTLVMNLASNSSDQIIRIFNVNGELLISEKIAGNGDVSLPIDLGDVPAGMYYVQVISDGAAITKKVIIY